MRDFDGCRIAVSSVNLSPQFCFESLSPAPTLIIAAESIFVGVINRHQGTSFPFLLMPRAALLGISDEGARAVLSPMSTVNIFFQHDPSLNADERVLGYGGSPSFTAGDRRRQGRAA